MGGKVMEGIVYLHNLAGQALAQANAEIDRLRERIAELEEEAANKTG
jgi:hypothetical protein